MAASGDPTAPHLPTPAPIDAYGNGGFRFGGLSHRGSLLCLPNGIWAWPVERFEEVDETALAGVFAAADRLDMFLIGSGRDIGILPPALRARFRDAGITADVMPTGAAVRIYNIVLGEGRRAGAGLIAVP